MRTICIILSVFICLVLLWHLLTLRYYQPAGIVLYLCMKRGGKSCTVAKNCLKFTKKGITTYCNCDDISVPGVRIFNTEDLGRYKVENSHIELDEVALWYDNRAWKQNQQKNADFVKWLRSVGHLNITVNMYSQDYSIDKRIRQLCDAIYIGKKYLRVITVWRRLKKQIAIKDSALDAESQIVDSLDFTPWYLPGSVKFTWIPKYIGWFDSFKDLYSTEGPLPYHLSVPDNTVENEG